MPLKTIQELRDDYQAGRQIVVGVIGNSIGCGYRATGWERIVEDMTPGLEGLVSVASQNDPLIDGWPQQLQVWLKEKNATSLVQNYSGSGWTCRHHIERNSVAILAARTPKPSMVFVPLQVNDRLKDVHQIAAPGGVSWDQFIGDQMTLIQQIIDYGMRPILVKECNQPLSGGNGWSHVVYTDTGDHSIPHRPFRDYVNAIDPIARHLKWSEQLGECLAVVDCYTPTLNDGSVPRYIFDTGKAGGATMSDIDNPAPLDWRSDTVILWIGGDNFDPIHSNSVGHHLMLNEYKKFIDGTQVLDLVPKSFVKTKDIDGNWQDTNGLKTKDIDGNWQDATLRIKTEGVF